MPSSESRGPMVGQAKTRDKELVLVRKGSGRMHATASKLIVSSQDVN